MQDGTQETKSGSIRAGCSLPVSVTRKGKDVAIHLESGETVEGLESLKADLSARPPESFEMEGRLTAFRGWTAQPAEVLEALVNGYIHVLLHSGADNCSVSRSIVT